MAFSHSPKIATDNLVFYYDTGNGKSYKGEPTTNLIPGVANPSLSVSGWYETGWTGAMAVDTTEDALVLTATNGWHSMSYDFGVLNSPITVRFKAKLKSKQTTAIPLHVVNGRHLGDYDQWLGSIPTPTLSEYQEFTATFTPTSRSLICLVLRGADTQGLTDEIYIKDLQVEQKDHATQFVNGSRSVTEGLLDLTKNETLNLSTAGFDSDANLTFDGTNDHIVLPSSIRSIFSSGPNCVELVLYKSSADQFNMVPFDVDITRWNLNYNMYVANQWSFDFYDGTEHYIAAGNYDDNYVHFVLQQLADGTMEIYANGELKGSEAAGSIAPNGNSARIGSRTNGSYYFKGELPLVKIYNQALTADKVAQNYNAIKNRFGI